MRKLIWFTLGFGTACGISAYFSLPKGFALLFVVLAVASLICFRGWPNAKRATIVLLGISAGFFWFGRFQVRYLNSLYELDGLTQETVLRCNAYGEDTDYGSRVKASITIRDRNYPVMVYLEEGVVPEPGTILAGDFRFQVTAPGGQKESSFYQGEGMMKCAWR